MTDAIIFDTETTGLVRHSMVSLSNQPRIIEFAAIRINKKGKEVDRLDFLCDPGIPISEEITKITGIKQSDIKRKKPFAKHIPSVVKIFKGCATSIAHNLSFDKALVSFDMKRANSTNWNYDDFIWPKHDLCTVEATIHLLGRRMRLIDLHQYLFGLGFEGAHRAMTDVEALKHCVLELMKRGVIEL